jgi:signal transduction histidine kinase
VSSGAGPTMGFALTSRARRLGPVLRLPATIAAGLGVLTTVIWILTGAGYFWPAWVWFGGAMALAFPGAVIWARMAPPGPMRRLEKEMAIGLVVFVSQVLIWMLSGLGYFWPVWTLLGLVTLIGAHALWLRSRGHDLRALRERQLSERVDVLTRTRRGALDVQAAELRRIERDLHDGAQARLVALSMRLGRAEEGLADRPETAELLREARADASAAIAELRDLARGIAPPILADRGLVAAVEGLGRRAAIPVTVEAEVPRRPPPVLETAAYFVVSEALTNVAKHAPAAEAKVEIDLDAERLRVVVGDDGPGGADAEASGLRGLRQRVEALDGTMTVESPPGAGTRIEVELPCE